MREDKQSKSIIVIIVTPGYLHETFCHNVCWHKLPAVFWWKQGPHGLELHKVVTLSNSARFQPSRIFWKPLQMSPCQMGCGHMGDTDWPRSSRARLASQGRQSETTRIRFTFWKSFNATWFTLTLLLLWYVCKKNIFFLIYAFMHFPLRGRWSAGPRFAGGLLSILPQPGLHMTLFKAAGLWLANRANH